MNRVSTSPNARVHNGRCILLPRWQTGKSTFRRSNSSGLQVRFCGLEHTAGTIAAVRARTKRLRPEQRRLLWCDLFVRLCSELPARVCQELPDGCPTAASGAFGCPFRKMTARHVTMPAPGNTRTCAGKKLFVAAHRESLHLFLRPSTFTARNPARLRNGRLQHNVTRPETSTRFDRFVPTTHSTRSPEQSSMLSGARKACAQT
jgi:hypothetical protein